MLWYKLTKQSEAINDYYQDTADLSAAEIKAELQQILTTSGVFDAEAISPKLRRSWRGCRLPIYGEFIKKCSVQPSDSKTAGQLLYHLAVEVPHDSYLFKPDPDFSLLANLAAQAAATGAAPDLMGEPIERAEAEKMAEKLRQAGELLVENNLIPAGALGVEYDETQHDVIVYSAVT